LKAIGSRAPIPSEPAPAPVVKGSLAIAGHRTSVSLEDAFWRRLRRLAEERGLSVNALAAEVDAARGEANLSSAIRVYLLDEENAHRDCLDANLRNSTRPGQ
jgi:predicted DNA-binding ribbon-helix-helix protein